MTRTYIIAADGTRFVKVGRGRRLIGKAISAFALITTALFLSAAIIGLGQAAREGGEPNIAPTSTAQKAINMRDALKACKGKAPKGSLGDCLALYLRAPWFDGKNSTVAGKILVKECISEYKGRELADCLKQPLA